MRIRKIWLCTLAVFVFVVPTQASLLNLTIDGINAESTLVNVNYVLDTDPLTGTLSATGSLSTLTDVGFVWGTFGLSATILRSSGQVVDGTLHIEDQFGGQGVLVDSGTVSDFGFGAEDKFEFIFFQELAGGSSVADENELVGVIIDGREIPGMSVPDFTVAFSNGGNTGKSDTFVIPEPNACALMLGLGVLATLRRRPRNQALFS